MVLIKGMTLGVALKIALVTLAVEAKPKDEFTRQKLRTPDMMNFGIDDTKTSEHVNQCAKMMDDLKPTQQLQSLSGIHAIKEAGVAGVMSAPAAACTNGSAVTPHGNYACSNVDLSSFLSIATLTSAFGQSTDTGSDVWGWTHSESDREFAIMCLKRGTAFVEITDPVSPVYKGVLPHHNGLDSIWCDVKTYNNHAFIVTEARDHGMLVFDLTQLLTGGTSIRYSPTARYSGIGKAHNMVINEESGFAYAVGSNTCSGGLHMIDIRNPVSPQFSGCFSADGYTHDAHCVMYHGPDSFYQGRELCFACNEDSVTIVDVTTKSNPVQISRMTYANSQYTHQGWLTEDHKYFMFGDELDEKRAGVRTTTLMVDVQDVDSPTLKYVHRGTTEAIDHNQYVVGDYLYQANYRAGLQVLHLEDLTASTPVMSEIGMFDIYPADNSSNFNGAWSVYPFFPSGTVVVSGIEQGLYILKPTFLSSPSPQPSASPSASPSGLPSGMPSARPSTESPRPSVSPSESPSKSGVPSSSPSTETPETTASPSASPSESGMPSASPSKETPQPSAAPSESPSSSPSNETPQPSSSPSVSPSMSVLPSSSPVESGPVTLNTAGFESGWDGWVAGGRDAYRSYSLPYEGSVSAVIRDNSGENSAISWYEDVSLFSEIRITFNFQMKRFRSGEDFFLEVNDGSQWTIYESWVRSRRGDVQNNIWYSGVITIDATSFGQGFGIRFRCDASSNRDKVFIDNIQITGLPL